MCYDRPIVGLETIFIFGVVVLLELPSTAYSVRIIVIRWRRAEPVQPNFPYHRPSYVKTIRLFTKVSNDWIAPGGPLYLWRKMCM